MTRARGKRIPVLIASVAGLILSAAGLAWAQKPAAPAAPVAAPAQKPAASPAPVAPPAQKRVAPPAQKPAALPAPAAPPAAPVAVKYYPEPDRAALDALQMKPAPELENLQWVQGGPATVAAQKGKVVLLVFWSRLCGPCVAALPQVQGLLTKYEKQGLVVISIHDPIASANLKEALNGSPITYPVAIEGTARKNIGHYQVRGYPYFTFIDRAGKIRYADVLFDSLEQAAEELLKEPVPK